MALKFFDKDLDTIELKFIGFFFILMMGIISLIVGIDLITGFLGGVIVMIVRDIYRTDTNEAARTPKQNGGNKWKS